MAYVAFASAKASPGVTTTITALAATWPRDRDLLVAELDPAGGDLGVRFDLATEPGLVTPAAAGRRRPARPRGRRSRRAVRPGHRAGAGHPRGRRSPSARPPHVCGSHAAAALRRPAGDRRRGGRGRPQGAGGTGGGWSGGARAGRGPGG